MENIVKDIINSNTNEIKTDDMVVSQNILKFNHTTIQLSNISQVVVGKPKLKIPWLSGIIFLITFTFIFNQSLAGFLLLIDFIALIGSAVPLYRFYSNIRKDTKYLILYLNSGRQYSIVFQSAEFADKVRSVIEGAFNQKDNKDIKVSIENQTINSGEKQNINYGLQKDNMIHSNNSDSSINIANNKNMQNLSIGDNTKNKQYSQLNIENEFDWHLMKKELEHVIFSIKKDNHIKKTCEEAIIYIDKKDKEGFIEFVKSHQNELTSDLFVSLIGGYLPVLISSILNS